ncbi:unnamed protein product [Arctia plantaginis]|uniref:Gamma-interferon-inducible lysosomal thiol reductase n=1 Tax=Arctia plantaginis TaxID=874455 RepID=A0A8S1A3J2_ARCPL|nr:unnamed protein product [Arctia plantaginis]CAB3240550.1 unnamed protein product [Arctia plantaginis]
MFKLMFVVLFLVGVALCSPRPNNAIPASTSSPTSTTSTTVDETTKVASKLTTLKEKVQLTIFYETLCPYSIEFFVEKLEPAVLKLGSYLDLQLVPYGKAQTSNETDSEGRYSFTCQHGAPECRGNLAHACAIDVLRNNTHAVIYNSCLMQSSFEYSDPEDITRCGVSEKVPTKSINDIGKCINGTRGSTLLKSYGEITKANKVLFVPHLKFDGSTEHERDARNNLITVVCNLLNPQPPACHST